MLKILTTGNSGYSAANLVRFDGIQLAADNITRVETDHEKVPTAWRLLNVGTNELTLEGNRVDLVLSADHMKMIIDYHKEKGVQIPIDSNHFLKHFADKKGVDESEVLKMIPSGALTMGYGSLRLRADGLWFEKVQFNPLAREMVKEKSFKYFSPVIRGLVDGRLRVTSVAMENEPAINNLDALAASADQRDEQAFKQPQKEKKHMDKLCAALSGLLGMDSLSLSANGDAPEDVVTKINNLKDELPGLRQAKTQHDGLVGKLRDSLSLGADADDSTIHGTIAGLVSKANSADSLKTRVDSLEMAAEKAAHQALIDQGMKEGKLSQAMVDDWASKQDSVALSAFLKAAPQVVPLGKINKGDLSQTDTVALSAEDRKVCAAMGLSEKEFLKSKKGE